MGHSWTVCTTWATKIPLPSRTAPLVCQLAAVGCAETGSCKRSTSTIRSCIVAGGLSCQDMRQDLPHAKETDAPALVPEADSESAGCMSSVGCSGILKASVGRRMRWLTPLISSTKSESESI